MVLPECVHSNDGVVSAVIAGPVISTDELEQEMIHSKQANWSRAAGAVIGAGLLALSGVALATDQAEQRRDGRDAKQDSKDQARKNKVDCKAEDQKSNAECRHDKRDTKQDGRQEKRDIKR
jgi:hypothetical protein